MREVTKRISLRARSKIRRFDGDTGIFEHYGLERALSDAFSRKVPLKSGGYLVIDETEALVAVDVNTGHYKGNGSQENAILEVNLEAVDEVARQLRLRNIGGLVVLDLIDMKSRKHQNQVYKALKTALTRDRARTNVLQISELGLLEMSRQRQDQSILSRLTSKCPYCSGHGFVKSPMAISIEIQRKLVSLLKKAAIEKRTIEPKVVIAPQVMHRLKTDDSNILADIQRDYDTRLTFVSELHRHPESFSIIDANTSQVLYSQS
jgi:ribonuclease G